MHSETRRRCPADLSHLRTLLVTASAKLKDRDICLCRHVRCSIRRRIVLSIMRRKIMSRFRAHADRERRATIYSRCIPKLAQISGWPFSLLFFLSALSLLRLMESDVEIIQRVEKAIFTRKRTRSCNYCNRTVYRKGSNHTKDSWAKLAWLNWESLQSIGYPDSPVRKVSIQRNVTQTYEEFVRDARLLHYIG